VKTIDTLVDDIYSVIETGKGWSDDNGFVEQLSVLMRSRMAEERGERRTLRMSNVGSPCARKLWYSLRPDVEGEPLSPRALSNFLFGDILEELLLSLAVSAGHDVVGRQDEVHIGDIKGHRDAVIDGVLIDVKSASGRAFPKFKKGTVTDDDPFGYLWQLACYLYAAKDDPLVRDKTTAGFLVFNKENGEIALDLYDLSSYLDVVPSLVSGRQKQMTLDEPPERAFEPVPDGKSGNMKLPTNCSYCAFKEICWPEARLFLYSNGPRWLTTVERLPDVPETTKNERMT
jgi:CRISPR/Cas system-associated exonuclease Cas4 (RecB family)